MTGPTDSEREAVLREVRELLGGLIGTSPRYRYVASPQAWMFCWTTEPVVRPNGVRAFAAFVYRPVGAGARNGHAQRWARQRLSYRVRRKDAKALALRWYEARLAKER